MIYCTPQVKIIVGVHMGEIRLSPAPNILSGPAHLCTESSILLVRGLLLSCDEGAVMKISGMRITPGIKGESLLLDFE